MAQARWGHSRICYSVTPPHGHQARLLGEQSSPLAASLLNGWFLITVDTQVPNSSHWSFKVHTLVSAPKSPTWKVSYP